MTLMANTISDSTQSQGIGHHLSLFQFHNNKVSPEVNKDTLQHLLASPNSLGQFQLAFAQIREWRGFKEERPIVCEPFLRKFDVTDDNRDRTLTRRALEAAEFYICKVPDSFPTGVYIWSIPVPVKLANSVEISLWCTYFHRKESDELSPNSEQILRNIFLLTCSIELDTYLEESRSQADEDKDSSSESQALYGLFLKNNSPENALPTSHEVLMHESIYPECTNIFAKAPLVNYIESILTFCQPEESSEVTLSGHLCQDNSNISETLRNCLIEIREATQVLNKNEYSQDEEYIILLEEEKSYSKSFTELCTNHEEFEVEFSKDVSIFHLLVCKLFEGNVSLTTEDFENFEMQIDDLNTKNNEVFAAACKQHLATCKIYNYCLITAERSMSVQAQIELRSFFKKSFLNLLKIDVYTPLFLSNYFAAIKHHLGEIWEMCNFKLTSSEKELFSSQLETDFEKWLFQNDINILKGHRRVDKVTEELKLQYIDDIEEFLEGNESKFSLEEFEGKNDEIEKNLKSVFEASLKSDEKLGNRISTEVYWKSFEAHIQNYKMKIEVDFHPKNCNDQLENLSNCPENSTPLVFQFNLSNIMMGISKQGYLQILTDEFGNSPTCTTVGFNGSKFIFPSKEGVPFEKVRCWQIGKVFENREFHQHVVINGNNIEITVDFLLGLLLRRMKQAAEQETKIEYQSTIITVPFSLSPCQRRQVQNAGVIAGFKKVQIVSDILAVAFYLCFKHPETLSQNWDSPVLLIWQNGENVDVSVFRKDSGKLEMVSHSANYVVKDKWTSLKANLGSYLVKFHGDRQKVVETSVACTNLIRKLNLSPSVAIVASETESDIMFFEDFEYVAKKFCGNVKTVSATPLFGGTNLAECKSNLCEYFTEIPNATIHEVGSNSNEEHLRHTIEYDFKGVSATINDTSVTHTLTFMECGSLPGKRYEIGRIVVMAPEVGAGQKLVPKCKFDTNGFLVVEELELIDPKTNYKRIIQPRMWEWKTGGIDQMSIELCSNQAKSELL